MLFCTSYIFIYFLNLVDNTKMSSRHGIQRVKNQKYSMPFFITFCLFVVFDALLVELN